MTRKDKIGGLGKSLQADRRRQWEQTKNDRKQFLPEASAATAGGSRSVLESSNLDDLIAHVELRKEMYLEEVGETEYIQEGPTLIDTGAEAIARAERIAADRRELVSIPRRPQWTEGMSVEELTTLENDAFADWRRGLFESAQQEGLHLTPYERNLDFWRQLWRCVERSDLIVQILDARDPHFYHSQDLTRYVEEVGPNKRVMLLVNKADHLTNEQRQVWQRHFAEKGLDAIFFSALRELRRRVAHEAAAVPVGSGASRSAAAAEEDVDDDAPSEAGHHGDESDEDAAFGSMDDDDLGVADCNQLLEELLARLPEATSEAEATAAGTLHAARRGTVGFVGYPNVGKSTVINALFGAKKVGMSKTPGKTKHIQTLELPTLGVTFCDCPGLVFPSVVATKAHLVINNTVPLDDLRECFTPVKLIVEKIGFQKCLEAYKCASYLKVAQKNSGDHVLDDCHGFLAALAMSRAHTLNLHVPDENWAARKVLRDYVAGTLLYCEMPPDAQGDAKAHTSGRSGGGGYPGAAGAPLATKAEGEEDISDEDFDDLDDFIGDVAEGSIADTRARNMTKRKARFLNKQLLKGAPVPSQSSAPPSRERRAGGCGGRGGGAKSLG